MRSVMIVMTRSRGRMGSTRVIRGKGIEKRMQKQTVRRLRREMRTNLKAYRTSLRTKGWR